MKRSLCIMLVRAIVITSVSLLVFCSGTRFVVDETSRWSSRPKL